MKWIKTTDQLPEDNVEVLGYPYQIVTFSSDFYMCKTSPDLWGTKGCWWEQDCKHYADESGHALHFNEITHWMPLPKEP